MGASATTVAERGNENVAWQATFSGDRLPVFVGLTVQSPSPFPIGVTRIPAMGTDKPKGQPIKETFLNIYLNI